MNYSMLSISIVYILDFVVLQIHKTFIITKTFDQFQENMASRYQSSSSEDEPVVSHYRLRPKSGGILKQEHTAGQFSSSTPPPTPLGGPEFPRTKLVSFDQPTKAIDGRSKFPGEATRYPRRSSVAKQSQAPTMKSKGPASRLLSSLGLKKEQTEPEQKDLISPMDLKPSRFCVPHTFGMSRPEDFSTHSRDTTVLRPYSPPLDGSQWSTIPDTRSHTPLGPEPTAASPTLQTPTPLGFADASPLWPRREFRTPTPLGYQGSTIPSSPTEWGSAPTF